MPKYTFNPLNVVVWPDDDLFRKAVFDTNNKFVWGQDVNGFYYVECKNKPRDLLIHGVVWEEVDE